MSKKIHELNTEKDNLLRQMTPDQLEELKGHFGIEAAAEVYRTEPCARTLTEDLEAHLRYGMVYSNDKAFIMARYVRRDMPPEHIVDPWWNDRSGFTDTIHIYLASGDLSVFFTFPHEPAKWISFERRNKLRFYSYPALLKRCTTA